MSGHGSDTAPLVRKRKLSDSQDNAVMSKCVQEKRRREQEKMYIEELAELISSNMENLMTIKADKCAILQEAVKQIKALRHQEESAAREAVQQSDVSSSGQSLLPSNVLGNLLLEALNGFLFVVNSQGKLEFISNNVQNYLSYTHDELMGSSVYNIIHVGDHTQFVNCLLPMSLGNGVGWGADAAGKKCRSFQCRMMVKLEAEEDMEKHRTQTPQYKTMQCSAVYHPHPTKGKTEDGNDVPEACLVCIASKVAEANDVETVMPLEQFSTRQDVKGKILAVDTSGLSTSVPHGEIVRRCLTELYKDCEAWVMSKHHREVMACGTATSQIYKFQLPGGNWVHAQTKSKLFRNAESKEPQYIMSMYSLISQHHQARDKRTPRRDLTYQVEEQTEYVSKAPQKDSNVPNVPVQGTMTDCILQSILGSSSYIPGLSSTSQPSVTMATNTTSSQTITNLLSAMSGKAMSEVVESDKPPQSKLMLQMLMNSPKAPEQTKPAASSADDVIPMETVERPKPTCTASVAPSSPPVLEKEEEEPTQEEEKKDEEESPKSVEVPTSGPEKTATTTESSPPKSTPSGSSLTVWSNLFKGHLPLSSQQEMVVGVLHQLHSRMRNVDKLKQQQQESLAAISRKSHDISRHPRLHRLLTQELSRPGSCADLSLFESETVSSSCGDIPNEVFTREDSRESESSDSRSGDATLLHKLLETRPSMQSQETEIPMTSLASGMTTTTTVTTQSVSSIASPAATMPTWSTARSGQQVAVVLPEQRHPQMEKELGKPSSEKAGPHKPMLLGKKLVTSLSEEQKISADSTSCDSLSKNVSKTGKAIAEQTVSKRVGLQPTVPNIRQNIDMSVGLRQSNCPNVSPIGSGPSAKRIEPIVPGLNQGNTTTPGGDEELTDAALETPLLRQLLSTDKRGENDTGLTLEERERQRKEVLLERMLKDDDSPKTASVLQGATVRMADSTSTNEELEKKEKQEQVNKILQNLLAATGSAPLDTMPSNVADWDDEALLDLIKQEGDSLLNSIQGGARGGGRDVRSTQDTMQFHTAGGNVGHVSIMPSSFPQAALPITATAGTNLNLGILGGNPTQRLNSDPSSQGSKGLDNAAGPPSLSAGSLQNSEQVIAELESLLGLQGNSSLLGTQQSPGVNRFNQMGGSVMGWSDPPQGGDLVAQLESVLKSDSSILCEIDQLLGIAPSAGSVPMTPGTEGGDFSMLDGGMDGLQVFAQMGPGGDLGVGPSVAGAGMVGQEQDPSQIPLSPVRGMPPKQLPNMGMPNRNLTQGQPKVPSSTSFPAGANRPSMPQQQAMAMARNQSNSRPMMPHTQQQLYNMLQRRQSQLLLQQRQLQARLAAAGGGNYRLPNLSNEQRLQLQRIQLQRRQAQAQALAQVQAQAQGMASNPSAASHMAGLPNNPLNFPTGGGGANFPQGGGAGMNMAQPGNAINVQQAGGANLPQGGGINHPQGGGINRPQGGGINRPQGGGINRPQGGGISRPQGSTSGMNFPQGVNSSMNHPQGGNGGINHPQGVNTGITHPQGVNNGITHPQGVNNGITHPQGVNNGITHPQGVNNGIPHPQGVNNGIPHPQGGQSNMSTQSSVFPSQQGSNINQGFQARSAMPGQPSQQLRARMVRPANLSINQPMMGANVRNQNGGMMSPNAMTSLVSMTPGPIVSPNQVAPPNQISPSAQLMTSKAMSMQSTNQMPGNQMGPPLMSPNQMIAPRSRTPSSPGMTSPNLMTSPNQMVPPNQMAGNPVTSQGGLVSPLTPRMPYRQQMGPTGSSMMQQRPSNMHSIQQGGFSGPHQSQMASPASQNSLPRMQQRSPMGQPRLGQTALPGMAQLSPRRAQGVAFSVQDRNQDFPMNTQMNQGNAGHGGMPQSPFSQILSPTSPGPGQLLSPTSSGQLLSPVSSGQLLSPVSSGQLLSPVSSGQLLSPVSSVASRPNFMPSAVTSSSSQMQSYAGARVGMSLPTSAGLISPHGGPPKSQFGADALRDPSGRFGPTSDSGSSLGESGCSQSDLKEATRSSSSGNGGKDGMKQQTSSSDSEKENSLLLKLLMD
ncbi:nuclear receptor coactivator 2-like isoform X3 [Branchiostoma lanceolatum]|uniref:nuclear receptor coactivator 2-like isoform X3 n=1 Tax=Branchiostoma lanceolatum TaxID=7740 RepID=UPI00345551D0